MDTELAVPRINALHLHARILHHEWLFEQASWRHCRGLLQQQPCLLNEWRAGRLQALQLQDAVRCRERRYCKIRNAFNGTEALGNENQAPLLGSCRICGSRGPGDRASQGQPPGDHQRFTVHGLLLDGVLPPSVIFTKQSWIRRTSRKSMSPHHPPGQQPLL